MGLLDLPEELLEICIGIADKDSVCALRLTSKLLGPAASRCLFRHSTVHPTSESAGRALLVLNSPTLNPLVRSIKFVTTAADHADYEYDIRELSLIHI